MNLKGIVLAGGESRRFGEDKAFARINGIPMIQRPITLLKMLKLDPVVITHPSRIYPLQDCQTEADLMPARGPLGGLYTACCLFENSSLLVLTCDMPSLDLLVLETLVKEHRPECGVSVFPRDQNRVQPFPGIYESSLGGAISERISGNELSMDAFIQSVSKRNVIANDYDKSLFENINRTTDLPPFPPLSDVG